MKKLLTVMMLCVCVFGLSACNKSEENSRTLEVVFKEEQKEDYEDFEDLLNFFVDDGFDFKIDIVDDEIIFTHEDIMFDSMIKDKNIRKKFLESKGLKELSDETAELIEALEGDFDDYDGNVIFTYIYKSPTLPGKVQFSIDKNGFIK